MWILLLVIMCFKLQFRVESGGDENNHMLIDMDSQPEDKGNKELEKENPKKGPASKENDSAQTGEANNVETGSKMVF